MKTQTRSTEQIKAAKVGFIFNVAFAIGGGVLILYMLYRFVQLSHPFGL